MTLVFKYKRIDRPEPFPSESAPAIPVTLIGSKEKIDVIGLLDSGADFSFIPYDMAEVLGLNLSQKPQDIGGISGTVLAIPSTMKINIQKGRENYTITVGVYFRRKDGYRKIIIDIQKEKVNIISFMDPKELPKIDLEK